MLKLKETAIKRRQEYLWKGTCSTDLLWIWLCSYQLYVRSIILKLDFYFRKRSTMSFIRDFKEEDLDDPNKRRKYWTISRSTLKKYRKSYNHLIVSFPDKKKKIRSLNLRLDDLKTQNLLSSQTSIIQVDTGIYLICSRIMT